MVGGCSHRPSLEAVAQSTSTLFLILCCFYFHTYTVNNMRAIQQALVLQALGLLAVKLSRCAVIVTAGRVELGDPAGWHASLQQQGALLCQHRLVKVLLKLQLFLLV